MEVLTQKIVAERIKGTVCFRNYAEITSKLSKVHQDDKDVIFLATCNLATHCSGVLMSLVKVFGGKISKSEVSESFQTAIFSYYNLLVKRNLEEFNPTMEGVAPTLLGVGFALNEFLRTKHQARLLKTDEDEKELEAIFNHYGPDSEKVGLIMEGCDNIIELVDSIAMTFYTPDLSKLSSRRTGSNGIVEFKEKKTLSDLMKDICKN